MAAGHALPERQVVDGGAARVDGAVLRGGGRTVKTNTAGKASLALAVAMGVDPSVDAVRAWFKEIG